jgi:hypothetical protein
MKELEVALDRICYLMSQFIESLLFFAPNNEFLKVLIFNCQLGKDFRLLWSARLARAFFIRLNLYKS